MADVYIVVEGRGEKGFVDEVIAPYLGGRDVFAHASLVGKPGHKGGVRPWPAVRQEICNFLKMNRSGRQVYVSTMFDYFRLPVDWPGRLESPGKPHDEKAPYIEHLLAMDVEAIMGKGFPSDRFIPYIQMHELESLILAHPASLAAEFLGQDTAIQNLIADIGATPPEQINDSPQTAPSKRIIAHLPEYERRKAEAAVNVLSLTGIQSLQERCPHFAEWLLRLESFGK